MQLIDLQHTFWTVKSTLIRLIFFYLLVDILLLNHMGYTVLQYTRRFVVLNIIDVIVCNVIDAAAAVANEDVLTNMRIHLKIVCQI